MRLLSCKKGLKAQTCELGLESVVLSWFVSVVSQSSHHLKKGFLQTFGLYCATGVWNLLTWDEEEDAGVPAASLTRGMHRCWGFHQSCRDFHSLKPSLVLGHFQTSSEGSSKDFCIGSEGQSKALVSWWRQAHFGAAGSLWVSLLTFSSVNNWSELIESESHQWNPIQAPQRRRRRCWQSLAWSILQNIIGSFCF